MTSLIKPNYIFRSIINPLKRYLTLDKTSVPLNVRTLHITSKLSGAPHGEDPIKNFEDFKWPNQVSTFEHYKMPQDLLDNEYNYPICRDTMGIRWPGYWFKRKFVYVKEMEPEIVVPDLEGFELKPYVSYKTPDINTLPLTAKQLFDATYARKIADDFHNNKIEDYSIPQEEIDQARLKAIQTGADMFEEYTTDGVRADVKFIV